MALSAREARRAVVLAMPVMLAYVSIGIPCGVMEAQVGFTPLLAFLFSATYYSGAGQFMVPNLWMAGTPLLSIFLGVSFVTTRQLLYSTAFTRYLQGERKPRALAFSALVTDETFGINLDRYGSDEGWDAARGLVVNVSSMLSWASANAIGAALGSVVELPVDVMSFGMTAIFICLLVGQRWGRTSVCVAASTFVAVAACKALGLGGIGVFLGALAGVGVGVIADGDASDGDASEVAP